jgi:hypothetical protein
MTSGERERRGKDVMGLGSAAVAVPVVFVGLVLGGCSSGKGTPKDMGDGAVVGAPVDDFLPAVRNAICERAVACLQHPDVATCLATRIVSDGFGVPAWVSSVKRGGARFDPAAAAACLDAIPRECLLVDPEWQLTQWLGRYLRTPPCLAAFVGSVQPNQRCESTIECANKHCGGGSPCPGGGAIGACRPAPDFQAPGATCDGLESLCEFDATCGPDGICLGPLPAASSCGAADRPCARATTCTSADGMAPYFCVSKPATGEACEVSGPMPCARMDDYCDATTNVCARRRKPGESCVQYDCVIYASCQNFVCKPLGNIGEACDNNLHPCVPDLPCVGGVCSPAPVTTCPP